MNSIQQAADSADGFLIFDLGGLYDEFLSAFLAHVGWIQQEESLSLRQFNLWVSEPANFEKIRPKSERILPAEIATPLANKVLSNLPFNAPQDMFISDEECLGFPNIYWRCVRGNSETDVWGLHADRWFWEIGESAIPKGWRRVKIWLPFQQPKEGFGLWVVPGSHKGRYPYDVVAGSDGKRRPRLRDGVRRKSLVPAKVPVGCAVAFNDNLLHSGISASGLRLSMELTLVVNPSFSAGEEIYK